MPTKHTGEEQSSLKSPFAIGWFVLMIYLIGSGLYNHGYRNGYTMGVGRGKFDYSEEITTSLNDLCRISLGNKMWVVRGEIKCIPHD